MVSLQPVTLSYIEETESCFLPSVKQYKKGSMMDTLMAHSPLMAYFAQIGMLDDQLDSSEFVGTCFAPCEEYCQKYYGIFKDKINHLQARNIVLSSMLNVPMTKEEIFRNYEILPTLHGYNMIKLRYDFKQREMMISSSAAGSAVGGAVKIVYPDVKCTNGMVQITNGLII